MKPVWFGRKVASVVSLFVLALTGCLGVYNGLNEWGEGETPLQHSVTIGVLLYGILGLVTAYGLFRRERWTIWPAIGWAIAVTYVPGVAVMAYGGTDAILGSAFAASAGSALIALGVIWTVRVTTRESARTVADS